MLQSIYVCLFRLDCWHFTMNPLPNYLAILTFLLNAYKFIFRQQRVQNIDDILSIPIPNYQSILLLLKILPILLEILRGAKRKKKLILKPHLMLRLLRGYRSVLIQLFGADQCTSNNFY